jgi:hypothetical protein
MQVEELGTSVKSMTFFDRLNEADICFNGHIRGCFEDVFSGMTVNDKLREMLINEESENCFVYTAAEKRELLYVIFKLFAVGGGMCQPDVEVGRYLSATKGLYRDLLTVYKAPTTGDITVSGKAYLISTVKGLALHHADDKPFNTFVVVIEPMRKEIHVLKNDYQPFW